MHMAELMDDRGTVLACDVHPSRLAHVIESRDRLKLTCITTHVIGTDGSGLPDGPFDAALVDVPCSNTGVLGKRPDVRWRITPGDLIELPVLQLRLVQAALGRLRPGGRIVYSTCSIEPAENERLIEQVLAATPGLTLAQSIAHRPGHPGDGGYLALLRMA